jgi:hypothetical protein
MVVVRPVLGCGSGQRRRSSYDSAVTEARYSRSADARSNVPLIDPVQNEEEGTRLRSDVPPPVPAGSSRETETKPDMRSLVESNCRPSPDEGYSLRNTAKLPLDCPSE